MFYSDCVFVFKVKSGINMTKESAKYAVVKSLHHIQLQMRRKISIIGNRLTSCHGNKWLTIVVDNAKVPFSLGAILGEPNELTEV